MNNPNYYAILTADVRYCPNLSPQEKLLFAEITALSQKDGVCFAGNNYFAELYGLTDTTISHQISALEKLGFIKIEFEKEGARVKKRMITVAKNRNGDAVFLAKKSNGTVAKNRKDNNTSILTLQVYNNNDNATKAVDLFIKGLQRTNPKIDRSDKQKEDYAKDFVSLSEKYEWTEINRVIRFATSSDFWSKICLSSKKIVQHFEKLYAQSKGTAFKISSDSTDDKVEF
jgi:DNA-binding transcriptional ArsR family regulator